VFLSQYGYAYFNLYIIMWCLNLIFKDFFVCNLITLIYSAIYLSLVIIGSNYWLISIGQNIYQCILKMYI